MDSLDPAVPLARRILAIRALRGGPFAPASAVVKKVLDASPPPELQTAAVETLSAFDDPAVAPMLLQ